MQRFDRSLFAALFVLTPMACDANDSAEAPATQLENLTVARDASVAPATHDECIFSEVHRPELQGTARTLVLYDTEGDTVTSVSCTPPDTARSPVTSGLGKQHPSPTTRAAMRKLTAR